MTKAPAPGPLAELAHELRTPLTAILGFADAMAAQAFGPLPDRYVEAAEAIGVAGRHMLGLVAALTDNAALEADRWTRAPERVRLRAMMEETLGLFAVKATAAEVSLRVASGDEAFWVWAEPRAVRQVLINLTANALAATPAGGEITLSAEADGATAVIAVRDTGPGPNPTPAGVGLGLRLVAAYCEAQGGAFTLSEAPGGGGLAIARLPILAASGIGEGA